MALIPVVFILFVILGIFVVGIVLLSKRFKYCPPEKVLVVLGRFKNGASYKIIHRGYTFVKPLIEDYQYLNLLPLEINLKQRVYDKKHNNTNVELQIIYKISNDPHLITNAVERLLGLQIHDIENYAVDIIAGQMRVVFNQFDYEDMFSDREKLEVELIKEIDINLNKIGLTVIDLRVRDIFKS